jgi:hypothetical protein
MRILTYSLIIVASMTSIVAHSADVTLPIKARIVRCVSCAEATAACQQGMCCNLIEEKCGE